MSDQLKNLSIAPQHQSAICPDAPCELDTKQCIARYTISSIAVDNDGDVLIPGGSIPHLDRYRNNPVVLWNHDLKMIPVAQSIDPVTNQLSWDVTDDKVSAYAKFHLKTLESSQIWGLVESGVLRGASVGYDAVPGKFQRIQGGGVKFLEWEPHEWSVCAIPVNPEALLDAVHQRWDGKSLSPSIVKSLMPYAPKPKNGRVMVSMVKRAAYVANTLPWVQSGIAHKDTKSMSEEIQPQNTMPPGAQAVAGFCADLEAALSNLNDALPMIEKEPILSLFEEVGSAISEQIDRLKSVVEEVYPDLKSEDEPAEDEAVDEPEKETDPEGEKADDVEEEQKEGDKAKTKAKINKSNDYAPHIQAMTDASELCKEMGESPNVPKSYRLACKSAHSGLSGAADWATKAFAAKAEAEEVVEAAEEAKADESVEPEDKSEELTDEEVKQIKALQQQISTLSTSVKKITGKV